MTAKLLPEVVDSNTKKAEAEVSEAILELGKKYYEAYKDGDSSEFSEEIKKISKLMEKQKLWKQYRLSLEDKMLCENCGAVISDDSLFCNKCGKSVSKPDFTLLNIPTVSADPESPLQSFPIVTEEKICPKCGRKLVSNAKFCEKCGTPV